MRKLLEVLLRLVDAGNTVVVIEHNLDIIKTADHIIDLGPEGGDKGGRIVKVRPSRSPRSKSYTGTFLADLLPKATTRARTKKDDEGPNADQERHVEASGDRMRYLLLVLLATAFGAAAWAEASEMQIPEDARKFRGNRYKVYDGSEIKHADGFGWHTAKAFCEKMGGHLVIINDAKEQEFIADLADGSLSLPRRHRREGRRQVAVGRRHHVGRRPLDGRSAQQLRR